MKKFNMKAITERYNNLMYDVCREYLTIGTKFSEDTENWNIRDMVCEVAYVLENYKDPGCIYYATAYPNEGNCDAEYMQQYRNLIAKMERFIKTYEPFTRNVKAVINHSSVYG